MTWLLIILYSVACSAIVTVLIWQSTFADRFRLLMLVYERTIWEVGARQGVSRERVRYDCANLRAAAELCAIVSRDFLEEMAMGPTDDFEGPASETVTPAYQAAVDAAYAAGDRYHQRRPGWMLRRVARVFAKTRDAMLFRRVSARLSRRTRAAA